VLWQMRPQAALPTDCCGCFSTATTAMDAVAANVAYQGGLPARDIIGQLASIVHYLELSESGSIGWVHIFEATGHLKSALRDCITILGDSYHLATTACPGLCPPVSV